MNSRKTNSELLSTNFLTSQIESGLFIRKTTTLNKQFDWLKPCREQLFRNEIVSFRLANISMRLKNNNRIKTYFCG